jgi:hypothetical protein
MAALLINIFEQESLALAVENIHGESSSFYPSSHSLMARKNAL